MDLYFRRRLLPLASLRRLQTISFRNDGVTYKKALAYALQKRRNNLSAVKQPSQYQLLALKSSQPSEEALNQAILRNNLAIWLRHNSQQARIRTSTKTSAAVLPLQSSSRITRRTSSFSSIPTIANKYLVQGTQRKMKSRVRLSPPNIVKSIKCLFQREGESMGCLNTLLSLVGTSNSMILRELSHQSLTTLIQLRDKIQQKLNQKKEDQRLLITFNHLPNGKRCIVIKLVPLVMSR